MGIERYFKKHYVVIIVLYYFILLSKFYWELNSFSFRKEKWRIFDFRWVTLYLLVKLGVSTATRKPTHPPKPSGPIRKPADPTPVMVGDGSPPLKTDWRGSDGGFSSSKPDTPDPTEETHERMPELCRSVQIHQYSGEGLVVFGLIRWRSRFYSLDPVVRWRLCFDFHFRSRDRDDFFA